MSIACSVIFVITFSPTTHQRHLKKKHPITGMPTTSEHSDDDSSESLMPKMIVPILKAVTHVMKMMVIMGLIQKNLTYLVLAH